MYESLLQPSAISTPCPIATASAPMASALATSAPLRMPPEITNCTVPRMFRSSSASTAWRSAASVGMPTCSMNTVCVAAVPPCMPSTTITSAPACTASFTSLNTRVAPTFT